MGLCGGVHKGPPTFPSHDVRVASDEQVGVKPSTNALFLFFSASLGVRENFRFVRVTRVNFCGARGCVDGADRVEIRTLDGRFR